MELSTTPSRKMVVLVGVLAAVASAGAAFLLTDIFEKKQEARQPFFHVVELDDDTTDPAIWGKNFPLQYDDYRRTVDMVRTRHGGSEAVPREPTEQDPRDVVSRSKLELIPQLRRMWAGYAFAIDFREARGHAYMLEDQMFTGRHAVPQPGSCLHCHSSVYTATKRLGEGDIHAGFLKLCQMPYLEAVQYVEHPVACIDCHDPRTMSLRITRPAFIAGIREAKRQEGIEDYDVHTMATRQEMRTYVCAQCHVEYYFRGAEKVLTYPWHNGLTVDGAIAYYDEHGFSEWKHAETGAPMLKAQHPEFELWSQGTHARAGVSCADCHMPYKRVGAAKISDHHVRSPLLNINRACQTCHRTTEQELLSRVETIQDRHVALVKLALEALVELIDDLKEAQEQGTPAEQLETARQFQRRASFYVDYIEAENSSGFHAPQEAARIAAQAIDFARRGQRALLRPAAASPPATVDDAPAAPPQPRDPP
jgi:nitrite reductase (cytochrome c-552)